MAASARHSGAREGEEDSDASTESLAPVSPLLLGLSAEFSLPDLSAQPNTSQNPGVWSAEGQGLVLTHSKTTSLAGSGKLEAVSGVAGAPGKSRAVLGQGTGGAAAARKGGPAAALGA